MTVRFKRGQFFAECDGVMGCREVGPNAKARDRAGSSATRKGWYQNGKLFFCPGCCDAIRDDTEHVLMLGNIGSGWD